MSEVLEMLKIPDLQALWQRFLESEEESIAASLPRPALSTADFPAWLLLEEPALAERLPAEPPVGTSPGEEHYRLVLRWIAARAARHATEEMTLRKALKECHPVLFEQLLRAVANGRQV